MKIVDKGVQIETDGDGKQRVKELLDIACDDKDEAERVKAALQASMEETIRKAEKAAGRR